MPERDHDFAIPSGDGGHHIEPPTPRLTNDDFRKLMMTPRASSHGSSSSSSSNVAAPPSPAMTPSSVRSRQDPDKAEKRKKKKNYYAKLKKQEDDKLAELAAKYRDRAKERRDGGTGERIPESSDISSSTSGYRAVAPDAKSTWDAAERRRQMIQESKFLGGDMEHTHLVKGLDFALLQKVRAEIESREVEQDEVEAEEAPEGKEPEKKKEKEKEKEKPEPVEPAVTMFNECRTPFAKNIVRTIFKPDMPERNELFFPGRMAYIIELDDEFAESDIPTTTIRSKADIQGNITQQATLSTNDIVINKLTQILSYLRAGSRNKKKKKDKHLAKEEQKEVNAPKGEDIPIYDDVDDYAPTAKRDRDDRRHREDRHDDRRRDRRGGDRHDHRDRREGRDREPRRSRFDDRERGDARGDRYRSDRDHRDNRRGGYFEKSKEEEEAEKANFSKQDKDFLKNLIKREEEKNKNKDQQALNALSTKDQPEGYAECYPGLMEMNDAIDDSDDEVDYSKMDLGNKKGPVGRWDFDTAEEYADYMSAKEALPKAAFQYGVKMAEGRKTRGKLGAKNEKAKLDKEWNQISAILEKRKGPGGDVGSSKKAKYD